MFSLYHKMRLSDRKYHLKYITVSLLKIIYSKSKQFIAQCIECCDISN